MGLLSSPMGQGLLTAGLGAMASRGNTMQAVGRGGLLARDDQPARGDQPTVWLFAQACRRQPRSWGQVGPQQRQRMGAQAQARAGVVLPDILAHWGGGWLPIVIQVRFTDPVRKSFDSPAAFCVHTESGGLKTKPCRRNSGFGGFGGGVA